MPDTVETVDKALQVARLMRKQAEARGDLAEFLKWTRNIDQLLEYRLRAR